MNIVGFSEGFHDAAICRIKNGNILHASHSERYSKVKNDKWLHQKQLEVNGCLGLTGGTLELRERTSSTLKCFFWWLGVARRDP